MRKKRFTGRNKSRNQHSENKQCMLDRAGNSTFYEGPLKVMVSMHIEHPRTSLHWITKQYENTGTLFLSLAQHLQFLRPLAHHEDTLRCYICRSWKKTFKDAVSFEVCGDYNSSKL